MNKPWTREWKEEKLNGIREAWSECVACKNLAPGRGSIVFGEGNPDADVLFVGEAPGEEEDKSGRPFVGRSGDLLQSFLNSLSIQRQDVYITNIVMCRPPENRDPTAVEVKNCGTRLMDEIYTIDPLIIVPVGRSAMQELMGIRDAITKSRGKPGTITIPGIKIPVVYDSIPIFHPSYLLRTEEPVKGKWRIGGDTDRTFNDLKNIFEIVEMIKRKYNRKHGR